VAQPHSQPVPLNYKSLTTFYSRTLDQSLSGNQALIDELKVALNSLETGFKPDEVESYYTNDLVNYRKDFGVGRKIRNSRAGTRYYQDLIRERYFFRLQKALATRSDLLKRVEADYDAGDYMQTAKLLSAEFPRQGKQTSEWPAGFTKRLPVHVLNPGSSARLNEPVVLNVSAIRKQAPDFNPRNFIVVTGARWIAARELPSQADDLDGDGTADQIVFLSDLRANEQPDYWIYYSPTGTRRNELGDETPSLALVTDQGMKMLDAGGGPGLGGITIWEAGKPYPAWTMKLRRRILFKGPVRSTVEVDLDGFKTDRNRYDIRERFSTYANGRYSENTLSIHAQKPSNAIQFSLGFTRMANDSSFFHAADGYFGSWGRQNNVVQEIGQAAIFRKRAAVLKQEPNQRQLVFTAAPGETSTFYLIGDWRRGRMFPVAPTVANWENEMRTLAARLHSPLRTRIGRAEQK